MKSKKKRIMIFGVLLTSVVLFSVGITYAFFSGNFGQTKNETVKIQAGTMELEFSDLECAGTKIEKALNFGDTVVKEFQIKNSGTLDSYAKISWKDLLNEFTEGALTYTLEYRDSTETEYTQVKTVGTNVPVTSTASKELMADNLLIPSGKTYIYKLVITYNNLSVDQTSDLNAHFSTSFTIDETTPPAVDELLAKANPESISNYTDGKTGEMYTFTHPKTEQTEALTDYRYIGANPNNWIRFNDEDWRIIGVFTVETESGEKKQLIKIIRNDSIGEIPWDMRTATAEYGVNEWSTASLKTLLNGDYYNKGESFSYTYTNSSNTSQTVTIPKGLNATTRSQIENVKWYLGGSSTFQNLGGADYYTFERGTTTCATTGKCSGQTRSTNIIQKVGLMYPSDYVYTYGKGVDEKCYTDGYNCRTDQGGTPSAGWLYNSKTQWTQAPVASASGIAFSVVSNGGLLNGSYASTTNAGRPAVYLSSDIKITGGDGSSSARAYTIE